LKALQMMPDMVSFLLEFGSWDAFASTGTWWEAGLGDFRLRRFSLQKAPNRA
jgi:hypothetical protein